MTGISKNQSAFEMGFKQSKNIVFFFKYFTLNVKKATSSMYRPGKAIRAPGR
jgi:hypothetical protein